MKEHETPSRGLEGKTVPSGVFVWAGLLFLSIAMILFSIAGFVFYKHAMVSPVIAGQVEQMTTQGARMTALITIYIAPLAILIIGVFCTIVGTHLLKAAGIVTRHVIPPQDYELLSRAIGTGNEQAITEYVRLSSLSGLTGTFTKLGLTGLPLATIVLTILLAVLGLFVPKFFDLAQLTLGAFI